MGFSDREIFRLVRDTRKFAVGAQLASRVTPAAVIPTALPILQGGEFRGMCAIGISLRTFADLVSPASAADGIAVSLVDRGGGSLGGSAEAARTLPVAARLAAAIVGGQTAFRDYGQDGQLYEFRLLPLAGNPDLRRRGGAGRRMACPSLLGRLGRVHAGRAGAGRRRSLAVWLGADRWCVRPLRYIRDFADRVARGDDMSSRPSGPGRRNWRRCGEGVRRWPRRSPAARPSSRPASSSATTCCARSIIG